MPRSLTALALALALGLSACGGDDSSDVAQRIDPLQQRIEAIGAEVSDTVGAAPGLTESELHERFAAHAGDLDALREQVEALDVPADLGDEAHALGLALRDTTGALREIADASAAGDGALAAQAARRLSAGADTLRDARLTLVREAGS